MVETGEIMSNLPTTTPAEALTISPEGLDTANCYLQNPNIHKVAEILEVPPEIVSQILDRKEVRNYINSVFFSTGFNNRFQVRELMDTLIKRKLQDMDEAEVGSSKDITELLALSHKMTMELLDKEIQLEKIRSASVTTQNNIQINEVGGSRYSSLIEKLMGGTIVND